MCDHSSIEKIRHGRIRFKALQIAASSDCDHERPPDVPISAQVNPMSDNIGFVAPYTPLHKVLLNACKTDFLIATSGNKKDEPIAKNDREAEKALSSFTSYFLHHTRPIHNRVDDSLATIIGNTPYVMRRARGFAPYPVMLPSAVDGCVLALGAHLKKNTITIAKGKYAFVSQYIGDLDNPDTCSFFEETIEKMKALYDLEPDRVICDNHPEYYSSKYAAKSGLPVQKSSAPCCTYDVMHGRERT